MQTVTAINLGGAAISAAYGVYGAHQIYEAHKKDQLSGWGVVNLVTGFGGAAYSIHAHYAAKKAVAEAETLSRQPQRELKV